MISTPSVPGPEPTQPAAGQSPMHTPAARLVGHLRLIGFVLAGIGGLGLVAALLSSSPLSFLLTVVCGTAGVFLIRAAHQLGLDPEAQQGTVERTQEVVGSAGAAVVLHALMQGCARAYEAALGFGRGVAKVLACLAAGTGTGLVTIGVFALRQPELWEFEAVRRAGPPFGPVVLGIGVGLLVAEALLIVLFHRPWSRPAEPSGASSSSQEAA